MSEGVQFEETLDRMFRQITDLPDNKRSTDEMAGPLSLAFEITRHRWKAFSKKFPQHVREGYVDDKTNICKFVLTAKVIEYLHRKYKFPELDSPDLFDSLEKVHDDHIDAFGWIDAQIPTAIKGMYSFPHKAGELVLRLGLAIPKGPRLEFTESGQLHEQLTQFFGSSEEEVKAIIKRADTEAIKRNFTNRNKKLKEFWEHEFAYSEEIRSQKGHGQKGQVPEGRGSGSQQSKPMTNVEMTKAAFARIGMRSRIPESVWLGVVKNKS